MISDNIIEQAMFLAKSGRCGSVADIERHLRRQGFSQVVDHLSGSTIRTQLRRLIKDAKQPA